MKWLNLKRLLVVGLVVFLVALLLAEGVARYGLGLGDPPLTLDDPVMEYRFKPGTYHRFGNRVAYNDVSMRSDPVPKGPAAEGVLRVLCLGDSVLNGGSQTDQDELATAILQRRLTEALGQRVWVGNVSAGSWGPGNLLAYTRQYGWFGADVVVILLSSHDAADVMTFQPMAGGRDFPSVSPWSALQEGVTRYLPKLWPAKAAPAAPSADAPPLAKAATLQRDDPEVQQALDDFDQLLTVAASEGRPVLLLQHAEQQELDGDWMPGHAWLQDLARQRDVSVLDLREALRDATARGSSPYRDSIHINAAGQKVLAQVMEPWLVERLKEAVASEP